MSPLEERVAYGRMIRDRAACLLEAHGPAAAVDHARMAADEPGLPEAERSFWSAVAERITRSSSVAAPVPS